MDPQAPNFSVSSIENPVKPVIPDTRSKIPADNHWISILAMAIFVIFALGVVVFLYYQNQQLKKMLVSYQPTPVASSTPAATSNPTKDWQLYTNSKYNFSFQFPLDWKVTLSPVTGNKFNAVVDQISSTSEAGLVPIQLSINTATDDNGKSLNLTSIIQAEAQYIKSFSPSSIVKRIITVDNQPAVSITGLVAGPGPGEGNFLHFTLIQIKNQVLVIQLGNKNYQDVFDQILSTFKFITATSSASSTPVSRVCTQDVKICPNGSSVGRTGPNCEFSPCPQ